MQPHRPDALRPRRLQAGRYRGRLRVRYRFAQGRPAPRRRHVSRCPNNTITIWRELPNYGVTVDMGEIHDGVAEHMAQFPPECSFLPADEKPVDIERRLRESGAEVMLCYLPVGSQKAVERYARACLATGVSLLNCMPVFIVSTEKWAAEFTERKIPVVGDDVKVATRFDHPASHHHEAVRRPRDQGSPHLPAQHRRQHRLPQHARPLAPGLQAQIQDRGRAERDARADARRRRAYRPVGLRRLAERQQGLLPADRGRGLRRNSDRARTADVGAGFAQFGRRRDRRHSLPASLRATAKLADRSTRSRPTR